MRYKKLFIHVESHASAARTHAQTNKQKTKTKQQQQQQQQQQQTKKPKNPGQKPGPEPSSLTISQCSIAFGSFTLQARNTSFRCTIATSSFERLDIQQESMFYDDKENLLFNGLRLSVNGVTVFRLTRGCGQENSVACDCVV